MKNWKYILLGMILFPLVGMVSSCSDDDTGTVEEFADWQTRNDAATNSWAANSSYRKIKCFSKDQTTAGKNADYIYVEVLEEGSGTVCPFYTDTVRVAYQGRLIPSASYPEGKLFTYTYLGDFDWQTIGTSSGASWKPGFATAVQHMHIGDRWRVRIPYALMYGSESSTNFPSYSNMVFDIALIDFWHPGESRPGWK